MNYSKNIILLTSFFLLLSSSLFAQTTRWRLSWDRNTEEDMDHYEVYKSIGELITDSTPVYTTVSHTDSNNYINDTTLNYIDSELVNGQRIYYRLKAVVVTENNVTLTSDFSDSVSAAIPLIEDIPVQEAIVGEDFTEINLDNYVYDPDSPDADLNWSVKYLGTPKLNLDTSIVVENNSQIISLSRNPLNITGTDTLIFTVADDSGFFDIDTVTFSVAALVAEPDFFEVYVNEEVTLYVLENDKYVGDTPKVHLEYPLGSNRIEVIGPDSVSIKYTALGSPNTEILVYHIINSNGQSHSTPVRIDIFELDAVDDDFNAVKGESNLLAVLENDSFAPSDNTISVDTLTSPKHGTLVISNSQFYYTPDEDYVNYQIPDSFQYILSSDRTENDAATVIIDINPVGVETVIARNDTFQVSMNSIDVQLDVLNNDSGIIEAIQITTEPSKGNVEVSQDNNYLLYTPHPEEYGEDSFIYTISNNSGSNPSSAVVYIEIEIEIIQSSKIRAFPIPFRPSLGGASEITFRNLPIGGKLIIYDLLGYPVYEVDIISTEQPWKTLNQHGKWVRSGLYLYAVKNAKGKVVKTDKVIIIR